MAGCLLWTFFSPVETGSVIYWVGFALFLLPVWVFLEFIGTVVLSKRITGKMPRFVRITYGVVILSVLIVIVSLGHSLFLKFFGLE